MCNCQCWGGCGDLQVAKSRREHHMRLAWQCLTHWPQAVCETYNLNKSRMWLSGHDSGAATRAVPPRCTITITTCKELRIESVTVAARLSLLLSVGLSTRTRTRRVYESLCHRVQHVDGPPVLAGCGGWDDRATDVLALARRLAAAPLMTNDSLEAPAHVSLLLR